MYKFWPKWQNYKFVRSFRKFDRNLEDGMSLRTVQAVFFFHFFLVRDFKNFWDLGINLHKKHVMFFILRPYIFKGTLARSALRAQCRRRKFLGFWIYFKWIFNRHTTVLDSKFSQIWNLIWVKNHAQFRWTNYAVFWV